MVIQQGTCATAAVKVALGSTSIYGKKKLLKLILSTLNYPNLKIPVLKIKS